MMTLRQSPRFKIPLSIVDLNADCLFQIFSHLQLPDLLNFRLQCSTLNDAVCKFFPYLTTLSIIYMDDGPYYYYETHNITLPRERDNWMSELVDDTLELSFQSLFRKEDFSFAIIGWQNYKKFLKFLEKYEIRNIKKLALIIDPYPNSDQMISEASGLFQLCPKVETLFLERSSYSGQGHGYNDDGVLFDGEHVKVLLETITELASLNELHFFAVQDSVFKFTKFDYCQIDQAVIGNFLLTMMKKLRFFSINHQDDQHNKSAQTYLTPLLGQNFENILELGFDSNDWLGLTDSGTKFDNLRSLTLHGRYSKTRFSASSIKNSCRLLKTLNIYDDLYLGKDSLLDLNCLPNLEKLTALMILVDGVSFPANGRLEEPYINSTIKHIEVEEIGGISPTEKDDRNQFRPYTEFFPNLLTITALVSPIEDEDGDTIEMKDLVYDKEAFEDFRLTVG